MAGDDELLLEAEPWVDQATDALLSGDLPDGRRQDPDHQSSWRYSSWPGRGPPGEWMPRIRILGSRIVGGAIRLGRLLRQDDVVVINDLVGLACIHIGTRGIYRIAQREGDTELALLASVVLGEVAPQRMMTATRSPH